MRIYFPNGLRCDIVDEEFVSLLKKANTRYVAIALESGDEEIQKKIKKNLDFVKGKKHVECLLKKNIYNYFFNYKFSAGEIFSSN